MVYTICRELSEVLTSSPPRKVLAPSFYMSHLGLLKDNLLKGSNSFLESVYTKSTLDSMMNLLQNFIPGGGYRGRTSGLSLDPPDSTLTLYTDAPRIGRDAFLDGRSVGV